VLFAALLNHHGQLGPAEIPAKRAWLVRDALTQAKRLGVPFTFPASHPFRPLTALRLSLAEVSGADQERVVAAIFHHGWAAGGEMDDDDALGRALDAAGLDGAALLAATRERAIKALLKERTESAIEAGVFGVPTMVARGALFWGSDRIGDLCAHLDGKLMVGDDEVAALLARRASASRRT
jgi:2-hydroxychromene-2-carboxylate isomerase